MDGSGDCGDDVLKELYPDDDIPEDLIGFLDDKVFSSEKKLGSILHLHFLQTLNWDQRERNEKEACLFGRYLTKVLY